MIPELKDADLRPVLHDQGRRQGGRPRPRGRLRHRPGARRRDRGRERPGPGDHSSASRSPCAGDGARRLRRERHRRGRDRHAGRRGAGLRRGLPSSRRVRRVEVRAASTPLPEPAGALRRRPRPVQRAGDAEGAPGGAARRRPSGSSASRSGTSSSRCSASSSGRRSSAARRRSSRSPGSAGLLGPPRGPAAPPAARAQGGAPRAGPHFRPRPLPGRGLRDVTVDGVVQVDRKGEAFCASCAALVRERTPAAPPPEGRTR